jgi:hypothetical protein
LSLFVVTHVGSAVAVSRFPLKHIEDHRVHSCISAKIAHIFPWDGEFGEEDESWCESGGEPLGEDDDDDDDLTVVSTLLQVGCTDDDQDPYCSPLIIQQTPSILTAAVTRGGTATPEVSYFVWLSCMFISHLSQSPRQSPGLQPVTQQLSLTTAMVSSLPHAIWDGSWVQPPPPNGPVYQMEGFTSAVFHSASLGSNSGPYLNLQATTLEGLVDQLAGFIDEAGRRGDYSQVLSSERTFTM